MKTFFVYKCKLNLSLALLYLVDLFTNKLKTKFNNIFYRIILNTNRIHNSFWRNFPARAKQTPSKVLFVVKKKRRPRPCRWLVVDIYYNHRFAASAYISALATFTSVNNCYLENCSKKFQTKFEEIVPATRKMLQKIKEAILVTNISFFLSFFFSI